jgi:hypothetical protein
MLVVDAMVDAISGSHCSVGGSDRAEFPLKSLELKECHLLTDEGMAFLPRLAATFVSRKERKKRRK